MIARFLPLLILLRNMEEILLLCVVVNVLFNLLNFIYMIVSSLGFNEKNDFHEVDQFGFVDIHEALVNGTIPANLQAQEANFNKIEDPSMLRARPDDAFASMRAEQAYGAYVRHEREKSANNIDSKFE